MGYFSQPSDLEWFNALLQFSTSIGEINTELLHKQRTLSLLRKQFTSLFGLNKEVCWQLIGSSDVNRWADWLTGSHVISHVFGLVGEYISLLLTNQHLEEEPPIVEKGLIVSFHSVCLEFSTPPINNCIPTNWEVGLGKRWMLNGCFYPIS